VIIDGRIADIAETGFRRRTGNPQFVLRELQLVVDSADSMAQSGPAGWTFWRASEDG
jgi:uncharacterized protein YacL